MKKIKKIKKIGTSKANRLFASLVRVVTLMVLLWSATHSGDLYAQNCATTGTLLFKEDFGGNNTGDPQNADLPMNITTYNYNPASMEIDSSYCLTKQSKPHNGCGCWYTLDDHTYPGNTNSGYLLQVNAANEQGQFYQCTIDNLCAGTTLYFSAWIASVMNISYPDKTNMIFVIESTAGIELTRYGTGNLPDADPTWRQYGFPFTVPSGHTSVKLRIINNGTGSGGNDFVMDDIEIRFCAPTVHLTSPTNADTTVCAKTSFSFTGNYTDDLTFGNNGNNLSYRWEKSALGSLSDPWISAAGTGTGATGISTNSSVYSTYTIPSVMPSDDSYYRLVVSTAANINTVNCRAMSNIVHLGVSSPAVPASGNVTKCYDGNTYTGSATVGPDESIVWYTHATSGSVTTAPSRSEPGYTDGFAEAVSNITGCVSATRRQVRVWIQDLPTLTSPKTKTICSGDAVNYTALSGGEILSWSRGALYNMLQSDAGTGANSGTGATISETFTNPTTGDKTVIYTFSLRSNENLCTNTETVTITVRGRLTQTAPIAPQTICPNIAPDTLRGGAVSGGDASAYTYQWQSRTTGAWTNFTYGTSANYKPGALLATTQYRRIVSSDNGNCGRDTSAAVTVTVKPRATAAMITVNGTTTVCSGEQASLTASLTTPGSIAGTLIWKWYPAQDSYTVLHTGETYTPSPTTTTTYYVGVSGSDYCENRIDYRKEVTVTVNGTGTLDGGTISADQTIASGQTPAPLTETAPATGGGGNISYQWQRNENGGGWSNIPGETGPAYSPPALAKVTQYRRRATDGTCPVYSNTVTIFPLIPVSQQYAACAGASVTLGFKPIIYVGIIWEGDPEPDPIEVTYTWYDAPTGGNTVGSGNTLTVSKNNSSIQTWWVEPVWNGITLPRFRVDLLLSSNCGTTNPSGCASTGTVIWKEDFDRYDDGLNPASPAYSRDSLPAGMTTYKFTSVPGTYASSGMWLDWYYALVKNAIDPNYSGGFLSLYLDDHTSPGNATTGRFLITNGKASPDMVYQQIISGLCAGTELYFSFWMEGHNAELEWTIYAEPTNDVLAKFKLPALPSGSISWKNYGFNFTVPANISSIRFEIFNNCASSSGNDVAYDDIEIRLCAPTVNITQPSSTEATACIGSSFTFAGNYTDIPLTFGSDLVYRWERNTSGDVNNSSAWVAVTGTENSQTPGSVTSTYTINPVASTDAGYYRLVVANAVNIDKYNCRAMSDIIRLQVATGTVSGTASVSQNMVCYNTSVQLTSTASTGGSVIPVYQWQQSIDGGNNWTDVTGGTGETSLSCITPPLTATTKYRLRTISGTSLCETAYSNEVTVHVFGNIVYVKETAAGTGDGSSWENAYGGLADPLAFAKTMTCIKQIWVAEGTYYPMHIPDSLANIGNNLTPRDRTFLLVSGVKIYGGFPASANSNTHANINTRDTVITSNGIVQMKHKTILSGDIDGNGQLDNGNAYHVVIGADDLVSGQDSARLDGFTITGGNADVTIFSSEITVNTKPVVRRHGGGMYFVSCGALPLLNNVHISGNFADYSGGGMYNNGASPVLTNVEISDNTASTGDGGGMCNYYSSPTLTNVVINNNAASTGSGGGMFSTNSNSNLTNVQISGNLARLNGGGISFSASSPTLINIQITGNKTTGAGSGGRGGGFYHDGGSPTLTNVTIAGNHSNGSVSIYGVGGLFLQSGAPSIRNSIIYGNTDNNQGMEDNLYPSMPNNFSYSLVEGEDFSQSNNGLNGTIYNYADIFTNPESANNAPTVAGDYTLLTASPAIDMGNNSYNSTPYDLAGNRRTQGCLIDLGAYEFAATVVPVTPMPDNNGILYVKVDGTGDGSSWENAYGGLADPLAFAKTMTCIKQIWVAEGTYYPTHRADNMSDADPDDRNNAFVLVEGVKIYGGFPDTANYVYNNTLSSRQFTDSLFVAADDSLYIQVAVHQAILSGDIGTQSDNTDNVYHVVIGADNLVNGSDTATLDGFTITGGNANNPYTAFITVNTRSFYQDAGGGISNIGQSSPVLTNLIITGNMAYGNGGGMYNFTSSSPVLTNVVISDNTAYRNGGGMSNSTSSPTLTNVHIVNNKSTATGGGSGGGIYNSNSSSPKLTNVQIVGNMAYTGGGILNSINASPELTHVVISDNSATTYGGGMYNMATSSPVLTHVVISGNTASGDGGGMYNTSSSSPTLTNVQISGNTARDGGGMYNTSSSPTLTNVTISGNHAVSNTGGVYFSDNATLQVRNSIIYGNTSGGSVQNVSHEDAVIYANSLVEDATLNAGIILNGNPFFVDPAAASLAPTAAGDYRLKACSPAIDRGDNSYNNTEPTDLDGNTRIYNTTIDLGAYEFIGTKLTLATADDILIDNDTICTGSTSTLHLTASGVTAPTFRWYSSQTAETPFHTGDSYTTSALTADTTFYISVEGTSHCENLINTRREVTVKVFGSIIYVKQTAAGTGDGSSWENAYGGLADPLAFAKTITCINEIWVAEGTYYPKYIPDSVDNISRNLTPHDRTFLLVPGVKIYGGFPANAATSTHSNINTRQFKDSIFVAAGDSLHIPVSVHKTILSGDLNRDDGTMPVNSSDNVYHVVVGAGSLISGNDTATVDGFTVTGGNARGSHITVNTESVYRSYGGGIYLANCGASLTLENLTVTGNTANSSGGGMYNYQSSPALAHAVISGNTADYGGGMYNYLSSPTLTHAVISGNTTTYGGSGISNQESSPVLTGVHITDNSASSYAGGGIYDSYSSSVLTNVVISGNTASNGGGMCIGSTSSSVLTNVQIIGNRAIAVAGTEASGAGAGGGILITGNASPVLTNVVISGNTANGAGGVWIEIESSPVLTNVQITGNKAEGVRPIVGIVEVPPGAGGGILIHNSPSVLTNVTISGNHATSIVGGIGVGFDNGGTLTINNTIIYGNIDDDTGTATDNILDLYNNGVTWHNSLLEGGMIDGNIILNGDPLFVDPAAASLAPTAAGDYRLKACSPAIDRGDNSYNNTEPTDLDGNPRIYNTTIDLGAYEFIGTQLTLATAGTVQIDNDTICTGSTSTLHLTAPGVTAPTFRWYSSQTATTPFHTGDSYTTSVLTADTVFYISVEGTSHCENQINTRREVTVYVHPFAEPDNITANDTTICYNTIPVLTAASTIPSAQFKWYDTQTSDAVLRTNATFSPASPLTAGRSYYLSVSSADTCENKPGNRKEVVVTVLPQSILNYPDFRIWACPGASGGEINLSKYLDTVELQSVVWGPSPTIDPLTGIIDADNLAAARTYTYTYTVTNPCVTDMTRKVYLRTLKGNSLKQPQDTIAICYEKADAVNINQIFGIDAGGTWMYDSPDGNISAYVTESAAYGGAVIMNGKGIYEDSSINPYPWHGITTAKRVVFTYTPALTSCLGGQTYKIVIILTPDMM